MFSTLKSFSVSGIVSLIVAALFGFGWWVVCFRGGFHLPPTADIDTAIWLVGVIYSIFAARVIADVWGERRNLLLAGTTKEEERVKIRIPLALHITVFVPAAILLGMIAVRFYEDWMSGVVTVGVVTFILCFMLSVALFMSDPEHDIWGPSIRKGLLEVAKRATGK